MMKSSKRKSLSYAIMMCFAQICLSQKAFYSIGYVGCGYDIMYGSPHSTDPKEGADPGFRTWIYNLTNYDGGLTPDQLYKIPYGVQANECSKCSLDFSYTEASGAQAYHTMQEESVSFSASGWSTSFSASKDYKEVHDTTSHYKNIVTETVAACCVYSANIISFAAPDFITAFKNRIDSMPTEYNDDSHDWFMDFIKEFGTHMTMSVVFGGQYGQRSTFSQESWSSMSSSNLVVSASASASAWGASAAVDTMTEEEKVEAQAFSSYSESQVTYNVGGVFPEDGSETTWMTSCKDTPMPISYELCDIPKLLISSNFPSDEDIKAKAQALNDANMAYCEYLVNMGEVENCDALQPDPVFPSPSVFGGVYSANDSGGGEKNPYTGGLNCPSGFSAYPIGRTLHPESNTGQNSFLCLSNIEKDDLQYFGGMFQVDDEEPDDNRVNPMTGGLNCSDGYEKFHYGRVMTAEPHNYGANQYYCFNTSVPLGSNPHGGFYMQPDVDTSDCITNYYTKAMSCPFGYEPYKIGRQKTPESKKGANQYVCLNNVFI